MHPDISAFPRAKFYADDNLLKDASGMHAFDAAEAVSVKIVAA